ncbi:MAG TPA: hypothetical protein DHV08_01040 [Rhodocyclaceae bacterium]|nr:hypothetical protein [Rhodocyclaceae bacterium]
MSKHMVTDDDLHAYVDARLPPARRAEIEAHLAADSEAATRVRAYQAHRQGLHDLFDPVLDEPIPASLRELAAEIDTRLEARGTRFVARRLLRSRIAAGVLIASFGGALGWLAHGIHRPAETLAAGTSLHRQAAVAHAVFSPDVRRPVEIGADHEDQLVTWLSKRLGVPVRPPKLAALGYGLIGGRLLPGNSGPVAQFMYQDAAGRRLTLLVSTEVATGGDTAFRFAQEGPVNVFYWIDGKFGYALSAGIPKDELAHVAADVYGHLENR